MSSRNHPRIAVLGAGFCGLAVAWHLLHSEKLTPRVTLFDAHGIGGGASGIAAGLLHPFVGAHSKLNIQGREGMAATKKLLDAAAQTIGQEIIISRGILRLVLHEQQQKNFSLCAQQHAPDVEYLTPEKVQALVPGAPPAAGIFMREGVSINSQLYLQGLWEACRLKGAAYCHQKIGSLKELKNEYDLIVVCLGAYATALPELAHLPLTPIKGQIFELAWPQKLASLPFTLNSQAYICMNSDKKSCVAGSTFERAFETDAPDPAKAQEMLFPKIKELYPALASAEILSCRAALRASAPKHMPLVTAAGKDVWVLSGMGSKGLLYHALYAEAVVNSILDSTKRF